MSDHDLRQLLLAFQVPATAVLQPLQNAGGFSGALLWKVNSGDQCWCMRAWPEEAEPARLRFIHATIEFAGMQVNFIPRLQRTRAGETLLLAEGRWWELTSWLPGIANYHLNPSPQKLAAALQALARLHIAWEHFGTRLTGAAPSPGIADRLQRLMHFRRLVAELRARFSIQPLLANRAERIIEHFVRRSPDVEHLLHSALAVSVPLQPCLRDVWHDHILFTGEDVTGIVDFGAVRVETVAGDLARLIGSLAGNDPAPWEQALSAYEAVRGLSAAERDLIAVFDRSTVILSGMQWLEWLLIDERQFDDPRRVQGRLDEILLRLET